MNSADFEMNSTTKYCRTHIVRAVIIIIVGELMVMNMSSAHEKMNTPPKKWRTHNFADVLIMKLRVVMYFVRVLHMRK